jgi:ABC-type branched-subunit amino acid transport system substrate-binding protein
MRARRRLPAMTLVGVGLAAVLLTGCQAPAQLGVSTTVFPVKGTCNTSAIVGVGAALPLSGADRAAGRAELVGLELGVQKVNQSGGVLTSHRCLELLYKNDRSDPAVDNQALLDLANREKVSMVVGPFVALNHGATGSHLGSLGITAASFSSIDETFTPHAYPDTFPIGSSVAAQAFALASWVKRRDLHRVAVVRSDSSLAGEGATAFLRDAHARGIEVTAAPRLVDSQAAASSVLTALKPSNPQALIVFDTGATLAPLLSVRHAMGWSVPVLASTIAPPSLSLSLLHGVDIVAPSALVVSHSIPSGLRSLRTHVLQVLHRTSLPGALTPYAQAFDAVEMFANAANGVNADDPGSVGTFLENANYEGLLGSYDYTSSRHAGLGVSGITLAPLGALSNGVYIQPTLSHS